jgi:23S rRNA (pseudouridine1915-N3)-methyltransferase
VRLHIVAVGSKMPGWVDAAYAEYARRMPPEMSLHLVEVRPEPRSSGKTAEAAMRAERARIESALPKAASVIALDEHGADVTTAQLAGHIESWRREAREPAFVIGGADGLDAGFKGNAMLKLRLSSLTLPHAMVRVLLAEQLYRAWSIVSNHPYHRA